ncbi:MAG: hypothetical protein QOH47_792 [Sphingomonadales bacterium]|jgi:hypothetical protein|nr:hypothetical protein [Sphingomonadales bacterium]
MPAGQYPDPYPRLKRAELSDTYTCSACRQTLDKGWADEEAAAELGATFPGHSVAECDLVCDDCHRQLMDRYAVYRGLAEIYLGVQLAKWQDDTIRMLVRASLTKMLVMTPKELTAAVEASEPGNLGHA